MEHGRKPNFPIIYMSSCSWLLQIVNTTFCTSQGLSLFLTLIRVGASRPCFGRLFIKCVKNLDFVQPSDLGVLLEFIAKIQPDMKQETGIWVCSLKHYLQLHIVKNEVIGQQL